MVEIINSIKDLIHTISRNKWVTAISYSVIFCSFLLYLTLTKPDLISKVTNTNVVSIPLKVSEPLDKLLFKLLDTTDASIVAVALYKMDKDYEERYITFLRQQTNGFTYPIPNSKYFLGVDDLYTRYLEHKRGNHFIRSFTTSNSLYALSCPFFNSKTNNLIGYVTIEYAETKPKIAEKKLINLCFQTASVVSDILSPYKIEGLSF